VLPRSANRQRQKTTDSVAEKTHTDSATDGDTNTTSEWCEIKRFLRHAKRKGEVMYQVQWTDRTKSWVAESDITEYAKDLYWTAKRDKQLRTNKRKSVKPTS